jgi:hypothetical protein
VSLVVQSDAGLTAAADVFEHGVDAATAAEAVVLNQQSGVYRRRRWLRSDRDERSPAGGTASITADPWGVSIRY